MEKTEATLAQAQLQEPKSSQGVFLLPCGWLDESGSLHKEVLVREITGDEEDLMASEATPNHLKINELLGRCVRRLGPLTDRGAIIRAIKDLTTGDRVFLLFAIRRTSVGDSYPFYEVCPSCKKRSLYVFDMSELEVREMPDPNRRVFDVALPSGRTAKYRVATGHQEDEVAQLVAKKKNKDDKPSLLILSRLVELDGKPPTLNDVKALGMRDREHLRMLPEEVEGGVDTTLEMECPHCGHDWESQLDFRTKGFFSPSAVLKRSKMKSST